VLSDDNDDDDDDDDGGDGDDDDGCRAGIQMEVIDNCAVNNGGCHQLCTHGPYGALCSCHHGYVLMSDATSCQGSSSNTRIACWSLMSCVVTLRTDHGHL